MTGFIGALFGLFGGKKANNQPTTQATTPSKGEAFFLDVDSAKGLGDIDYMRTAKSVKKSYPKAVGKLNLISGEVEESTSSMEKTAGGAIPQNASSTPSVSASAFENKSTFVPTSTTSRRSGGASSSMDMFRNMARDIKKKK